MRLIYSGLLSRDEASACEQMTKDYRYALELSEIPETPELNDILKERTWAHTGDSGCGDYTYQRTGVRYGIVQKNFMNGPRDKSGRFLGGAFLFLMDEDDHAEAALAFADFVVNERPFQTLMEVRA